MSYLSKLSLEKVEPVCGFEKERDDSYSISVNIFGERVGLFFEPARSFCNPEERVRIKLWNTSQDSMSYVYASDISGLNGFIERALLRTEAAVGKQFLQVLSEGLDYMGGGKRE